MGLTKNDFKTESKKPQFTIETSWDDGSSYDVRLAEILKKYVALKAVFYIIVGKVGEDGYLSWEQVKDLEKKGFEIGSHTMSHPHDLKTLYDEDLHYEVQNSKDILEAVLGHPVSKFCYPRGRFDERVQAKVIDAGYLSARGTGKPGILEVKDKYAIPGTIHIFQRAEYGNLNIVDFAKKTIDEAVAKGGYINIWGHSKEINDNNLWRELEQVLSYANSKVL